MSMNLKISLLRCKVLKFFRAESKALQQPFGCPVLIDPPKARFSLCVIRPDCQLVPTAALHNYSISCITIATPESIHWLIWSITHCLLSQRVQTVIDMTPSLRLRIITPIFRKAAANEFLKSNQLSPFRLKISLLQCNADHESCVTSILPSGHSKEIWPQELYPFLVHSHLWVWSIPSACQVHPSEHWQLCHYHRRIRYVHDKLSADLAQVPLCLLWVYFLFWIKSVWAHQTWIILLVVL